MKEITFDETPPFVAPRYKTVGEAWASVWRDPGQFVRYWNYKGAILSGGLRAPIFFITYLLGRESLKLAVGAALAQFIFRFLFAGLGGAMIQAFRRVEPAWKAMISILLVVPLISHVFEYLVQAAFSYATDTANQTAMAIVRSVTISVLSALFSLYVMRRNVMIVGEAESKSLFSDIARLPILLFHFCAFVPIEIARMIRRGAWHLAILSFVGFAAFSQLICTAMSSKIYWTYGGGKEIAFIKYFAVDGAIVIFALVALALIYLKNASTEKSKS
jgi:hypothetical protein